ncbi:tetratricopeptide repeat protein [Mesoterricola silvestris]|nr:tetratricopeptide repeat protein [Mesoterricola silvestris]
MDLRPLIVAGLLGVAAQVWAAPAPEDPFFLPPDAKAYILKATGSAPTTQTKLQDLLQALFQKRSEGGLGLVYDNTRTRTVGEVWTEGKANCLSMTAFFVSACRAIGIHEEYAEALNTNHWRKAGGIVRFERHVVALTPAPPRNDLIADFVPELRKRYGTYKVVVLPESRFRALFYSNRAVERLTEGDMEGAREQAQLSLDADPKSSVGWNILGVVLASGADLPKAEEAYRRAMELDHRDGAPIGNMEALLRNTGRAEEAQRYRVLGETVRKKDPYFHAYLAEEALVEGDLGEAQTRIRSALKILPKDPDFLLLAARVRLATGDLDGAIRSLEDARKYADPAEQERYNSKIEGIQGMKGGKVER